MDRFFEALKKLQEELKGIDFAVLGTYNLYLQGIKINPNDLDLIMDDEGIYRAAQIFGSEVIKNEQGYIETEFQLKGLGIHFVSNQGNDIRPPFRQNLVWIEKEGMKIPCLSLQSELKFYEFRKREKDRGKVELIKERIFG